MPSQGYGSSTLAGTVAARAKLSAVRQKLGMEQSGQNMLTPQSDMRSAAPTPGPAPKAVVSPQAQAVQAPYPMGGLRPPPEDMKNLHVPVQGSGEAFQYQHPPGQMENMQAMASQYEAANPPAPAEEAPLPSSPLAQFVSVMKRVPNPHELAVMAVHQKLSEQLGRSPSQEEIQKYFKPMPKETPNAP